MCHPIYLPCLDYGLIMLSWAQPRTVMLQSNAPAHCCFQVSWSNCPVWQQARYCNRHHSLLHDHLMSFREVVVLCARDDITSDCRLRLTAQQQASLDSKPSVSPICGRPLLRCSCGSPEAELKSMCLSAGSRRLCQLFRIPHVSCMQPEFRMRKGTLQACSYADL